MDAKIFAISKEFGWSVTPRDNDVRFVKKTENEVIVADVPNVDIADLEANRLRSYINLWYNSTIRSRDRNTPEVWSRPTNNDLYDELMYLGNALIAAFRN